MLLEWENNSGKLQIISGKPQNNAISEVKQISLSHVTIDIINHHFARIRIDSYNSLPIEETLTFHNIIILIKSVVINSTNNYYYNIFLEKSPYEDKSSAQYF